jgi:hypothetical protein
MRAQKCTQQEKRYGLKAYYLGDNGSKAPLKKKDKAQRHTIWEMRAQRFAKKKRDKTQMRTIWYARARKYTRRERDRARNTYLMDEG